jgi:hypothetical protein
LLAPLMTPLWMKLLGGTLVEVKFFGMDEHLGFDSRELLAQAAG